MYFLEVYVYKWWLTPKDCRSKADFPYMEGGATQELEHTGAKTPLTETWQFIFSLATKFRRKLQ